MGSRKHIYTGCRHRMHLFLPSARPCYTDGRLVKRSRALLGSNPTRDNRVRAGECSCSALAALTAGALFFFTPIHLPCHASENPIAALRSGENDPQILRKSPKKGVALTDLPS